MTTHTVTNDNNLKAGVVRRVVQVLVSMLIQALVLFGAAGTLRWGAAWLYFGLSLAGIAVNLIFMRHKPETIAERGRGTASGNWKDWDKVVGIAYGLFYFFGVLLVAGLDERFGWTTTLATGWQIGGFAAYALGSGLFSWAMITNAFFSTAVRIQTDRGHQVCSSGPYRFVRHPGYVGACLQSLAMPLLLAAINAADRERWRSYAVWLFLALICKFYVAVPVGVMGIALWWRGQRWAGLATAVSAAAWLFFAFFVMRPLFAPEVTAPVVTASSSGVRFYGVTFGQLDIVRATAGERLANGLVLFFPVLLLAWRAPLWLMAAAAISLPVLLGNGPGPIYDYRYHHYAVAVPFLLAGLVYGLERLQKQRGRNEGRLPGYLKLCLIITLIFNIAFVDTPLSPIFYTAAPGSAMGLDSNGYRISGRDRFKRRWLADTVSPDAPLLTDHGLGLALLNRETLYIANQLSRPMAEAVEEVDEVALDALFDFSWLSANQVNFAGVIANREVIQFMLAESDFDLVARQDGLLYFARTGSGLLTQIETRPFPDIPVSHQFGDSIGLVDVQIEPIGSNHFQIQADWVALRPLTDQPALIAVSRPGGLEHARIVHLPTLALLPTTEWPMGQIVRETFTFTLPDDTPPGEYPLLVGWYDTSSLYAAESDARSQIGDEVQLGVLTVP